MEHVGFLVSKGIPTVSPSRVRRGGRKQRSIPSSSAVDGLGRGKPKDVGTKTFASGGKGTKGPVN